MAEHNYTDTAIGIGSGYAVKKIFRTNFEKTLQHIFERLSQKVF